MINKYFPIDFSKKIRLPNFAKNEKIVKMIKMNFDGENLMLTLTENSFFIWNYDEQQIQLVSYYQKNPSQIEESDLFSSVSCVSFEVMKKEQHLNIWPFSSNSSLLSYSIIIGVSGD